MWRSERSARRICRRLIEGSALKLALLLALTCRCAGTCRMSLSWSDMTNGSMQGVNGVAAAVAKCISIPWHTLMREERHQRRGACLVHQLLSEPPRQRLPGEGRWLFDVSGMRGHGQKGGGRALFWLSRQHSARNPPLLRVKISLYTAMEWASSTIRPAIDRWRLLSERAPLIVKSRLRGAQRGLPGPFPLVKRGVFR